MAATRNPAGETSVVRPYQGYTKDIPRPKPWLNTNSGEQSRGNSFKTASLVIKRDGLRAAFGESYLCFMPSETIAAKTGE